MNRRQARELLMRMLFQSEVQDDLSLRPLEMHLDEEQVDWKQALYLREAYQAYVDHKARIDESINRCSDKWHTTHLPKAELAILRVAVTELFYVEDVPAAVAINEAVELAKLYGDEGADRYINGVLGKVEGEKETLLERELAEDPDAGRKMKEAAAKRRAEAKAAAEKAAEAYEEEEDRPARSQGRQDGRRGSQGRFGRDSRSYEGKKRDSRYKKEEPVAEEIFAPKKRHYISKETMQKINDALWADDSTDTEE